jgi:hypothetical protein
MVFLAAEASRIFAGPLNLSVYANQMAAEDMADMLEVTGFANSDNTDAKAKAFIVGQSSGTISVSGHLDTDTTANGHYDVLQDWKGTGQAVTYALSGGAALAPAYLVYGNEASFETGSTHDGTVTYNLDVQNTGPSAYGIMLENLTAVTADGNGTARDYTASSSNGAVAHLHVTAFSGLTNNIVTIQDSADGSTDWQTIVTFATYTAVTSERVQITGTVRRHLRVVDNVTGTGSTTRAVAIARL